MAGGQVGEPSPRRLAGGSFFLGTWPTIILWILGLKTGPGSHAGIVTLQSSRPLLSVRSPLVPLILHMEKHLFWAHVFDSMTSVATGLCGSGLLAATSTLLLGPPCLWWGVWFCNSVSCHQPCPWDPRPCPFEGYWCLLTTASPITLGTKCPPGPPAGKSPRGSFSPLSAIAVTLCLLDLSSSNLLEPS